MQEDLLVQIENKMSTFSKSQKLIANFILNSYEKAAYMTALKLGNAVNVSESSEEPSVADKEPPHSRSAYQHNNRPHRKRQRA